VGPPFGCGFPRANAIPNEARPSRVGTPIERFTRVPAIHIIRLPQHRGEGRMNREFLSQSAPPGFPLAQGGAAARATPPPLHLTPRELDVVRYVMLGESNKQIARRLGISNYTVRDHVSNLLKKAGVTSRSRLALVISAPIAHAVHEPVAQVRPGSPHPAAGETRPPAAPEAPRAIGAFWRTTR
jgi:DNA-binding CsgD family transcriptional regulator